MVPNGGVNVILLSLCTVKMHNLTLTLRLHCVKIPCVGCVSIVRRLDSPTLLYKI